MEEPSHRCLDVLMFGTYERSRVPRMDVFEEGLTAHGARVSEVNETLGLHQNERLTVLRRPWLLHRLIIPMLRSWHRLWRAGRHRHPDAVLVGYMAHFDVLLARVRFRRSRIVIDHLVFAEETAADRGASGIVRLVLRGIDRLAMRLADVIVVDTPEHAAMVPPQGNVAIVPVGAGSPWYSGRRCPRPDAPLRVLFFGIYTPLQGTVTIGESIRTLLGRDVPIEFTMVGTGQDHDQVRKVVGEAPNVTWVDWVAPGDLPDLARRHDVCLGIFGAGDKALRVVPNKVVQGCAAGLAIVTSDTEPQRTLLGSAARYVPPGDPDALADELEALTADRAEVESLAARARVLAEEVLAAPVVTEPLASELR